MIVKSISELELFRVFDPYKQQIVYGCNQVWYTTKWQRLAGCGPSTAAHLYYYLRCKKNPQEPAARFTGMGHWLSLMDEMWLYVTPSIRGVHKTKMFYEPLQNFFRFKGYKGAFKICDIPEAREARPSLAEVADFLLAAMEHDMPVAFLNLCNGDERCLDRWHWVTVFSLELTEDKTSVFVSIMDQGQIKKIDLALWYQSTRLGGGFVYFLNSP